MRGIAQMTTAMIVLMIASACENRTPLLAPSTPPSPPGPSVSSVAPNFVVAGSSDLTVTVTGKDFVNDSRTSSVVKWFASGSETVLATRFVSETKLTAVIPAALLQNALTAMLVVQNLQISDGSEASSKSNGLSFLVSAFGLSSMSPTSAIAGSPDLTVVVTGTGFVRGASWVTWAVGVNQTVLSTKFESDTKLTAIIPADLLKSPVTAQVLVYNGDIMGLSDGYFGYPKSNSLSFSVVTSAITGVYRATFTASASGASNLPASARERTCTATLLADGTSSGPD
jgi:IPT/TIG domain-containing protein